MSKRARELERTDEQRHLVREALTMALYVSITLLAAETVTKAPSDPRAEEVIWATTVGLALAHWCAFILASRLVGPIRDEVPLARQLMAELVGAAGVGVVATIVVVLLPRQVQWQVARYTIAACVGLVAYGQLRMLGASRARAFRVAITALAVAEAVAALKRILGH
jgi:hypothetical protein